MRGETLHELKLRHREAVAEATRLLGPLDSISRALAEAQSAAMGGRYVAERGPVADAYSKIFDAIKDVIDDEVNPLRLMIVAEAQELADQIADREAGEEVGVADYRRVA